MSEQLTTSWADPVFGNTDALFANCITAVGTFVRGNGSKSLTERIS